MSYFERLKAGFDAQDTQLFCLEEVDSTNTFLKKRAAGCKMLAVALRQTAGRGRLGRAWSSEGENVYASFYYPAAKQEMGAVTLCVALAVSDAVRELGVQTQIKWPNDIYAEGRKLCGILCEGIYEGMHLLGIVIGIGVNVNQGQFDAEIAGRAISIRNLLGKKQKLEEVVFALKRHLDARLERFFAQGFPPLREEYQARSYLQGKEVCAGEAEGLCIGVSQEGDLLLQTKSGEVRRIRFGEVTQRIRPKEA